MRVWERNAAKKVRSVPTRPTTPAAALARAAYRTDSHRRAASPPGPAVTSAARPRTATPSSPRSGRPAPSGPSTTTGPCAALRAAHP